MEDIAKLLVDSGAVKFGEFKLSSSKTSDYYIDMKEAFTKPHILRAVSEKMSEEVNAGRIAGMELGAVPILAAISLRKGILYTIIRKNERDHGISDTFIGKFDRGEQIDMIEDVATTGTTLAKSARMLRAEGAIITRAICVVDREEGARETLGNIGIELIPMLRKSELIKQKARI